MKKILCLTAIAALTMGVTACAPSNATTTIFPQGNQQYKSTSLSNTEGDAQAQALYKAKEQCKESGKELAVIKEESFYQGETKQKVTGEGAAAVAQAALGLFSPKEKKDNDYKVELVFACK